MSEATLVTLIRRISRLFYDDLTCIVVDYLCKHKKLEDNTFAKEYDLKANDVRGKLNKLLEDGFLKKKELNKKQVDEEIKKKVTKTTTFIQWTFNTDLMNVLKYRIMKLKQAVDKKVESSQTDKFYCDHCDREFDSMEVYQRDYICPFCDKELEKKERACKDPEKLRKEFNKIFSSFEQAIKALDEFIIPREFFGFDIIRKPNFNLPDNLAIQGFKNNQLSGLKLKPVVNIQFE